jgi:hypothetical protein
VGQILIGGIEGVVHPDGAGGFIYVSSDGQGSVNAHVTFEIAGAEAIPMCE